MIDVLDQLDAALDAVAAHSGDPSFVLALQQRSARLQALITVRVGEVDRVGVPGNAKSTAAWFAHAARLPQRDAKAMVRNARALRSMPGVADAFGAGHINAEHVRVLASAQACNPEAFDKLEDDLVDVARVDRFDLFKRHVTYWRQLAASDEIEDEAEHLYDGRSCHASRSFDGVVFEETTFEPISGSIFLNELRRIEHQLWEQDQRTGLKRTNEQRRHDAHAIMAIRSAAKPDRATEGRILLQVLVGYETFNGRICELADGTVITPGQVVSLLDEADVQRIVFESPSRVLDIGTRQRLFTGATRTAVQLAHLECQGDPSCTERFDRCEIDHIQPYDHWGETTQDNGRPLCRWHHRRRQRSP